MNKKCVFENCNKQPSFNYESETTPIYCSSHKLENMICLFSKKCIFENCKTRPSFNYKENIKPIYCLEHKLENMLDVNHLNCIYENCKIRPSFNYKENTKPIYCSKHKKNNMISLNTKLCIEENCLISASYNFKNKPSLYCAKHCKEGMICVKVKLCQEEGCTKQPTFNYKNEKIAILCAEHSKKLMVDIKHKYCIENNCNTQATFGYINDKNAKYCATHRKEQTISLKHKLCSSGTCPVIGNKKYENYCLFCFINTFPDKPVTRNYKTKEKAVNDYIKEQFPDVTWISDKKILDSCSKKRPDLLLDLGFQVLIIEIDENQHSNYEEICENKRIMELSMDLCHRPVIFIRFNPDDYLLNNKNVTSCWGPNDNGIMNIKKTKQKEWNKRLETLKETVNYWMDNQSKKTIELVYLFYDKTI